MMRAGALTYSIFVMVVATILCTLMILTAFANRSYFLRMNLNEVVRDNAYSGIAYAMANDAPEDYAYWKDIFGSGGDSVYIRSRRWGAFNVASAKASKQGFIYIKSVVLGFTAEKYENLALWLADNNRPLQLAGDVLLKGNCYLPEKGVEGAYIEGRNYNKSQFVYGESFNSSFRLPVVDKDHKSYWDKYLKGQFSMMDSVLSFESMSPPALNSFVNKTLVAYSDNKIGLLHSSYTGNIIFYSPISIEVSAGTRLQDVLLIAPKVIVSEDVKGNFHIVASDTVILKENCEMEFPSSINIIPENAQRGYCLLSKGVLFNGTVLCYLEDKNKTNDLSLEISENAIVKGVVYAEGNFELNGTIQGTVFCERFLLKTPSGIYENHILEGKIDRSASSVQSPTIAFDKEENETLQAAWLSY